MFFGIVRSYFQATQVCFWNARIWGLLYPAGVYGGTPPATSDSIEISSKCRQNTNGFSCLLSLVTDWKETEKDQTSLVTIQYHTFN